MIIEKGTVKPSDIKNGDYTDYTVGVVGEMRNLTEALNMKDWQLANNLANGLEKRFTDLQEWLALNKAISEPTLYECRSDPIDGILTERVKLLEEKLSGITNSPVVGFLITSPVTGGILPVSTLSPYPVINSGFKNEALILAPK